MEAAREKSLYATYNTLQGVTFGNDPITNVKANIDESFMGYGTAADEKILGWEGFTWMVERQREELKGMRPDVLQNPVHSQVFSGDSSALFVDELRIAMEDNTQSDLPPLLVRNSTILKYNGKKWMIIHFHGSLPDANTLKGSAWPIEEWKRKNAELEVLVKEKTTTLLTQNRELEIEAALERVRSKAMAMHNSEDIEIAIAVMFNQLTNLGIDMERCGIGIFEKTGIAEIWSTPLSLKNKEVVKVITGVLNMYCHPLLQKFQEGWIEKKDFVSYPLLGQEVQDYYDRLEKQPGYRFPKIAGYPDQQFGYCFFFKEGGIHVFTTNKFSVEAERIFKKFAKVFEQTYTRFLDLQKAEAQAREAQIEAALERVRTKAMAMRNSNDIETAIAVLFNQLIGLGIDMDRCGIVIFHENSIAEIWSTPLSLKSKEVVRVITGSLDMTLHPLLRVSQKAWNEKKDYVSYHLVGQEVQNYYEQLEKQPDYRFPKIAVYPAQQFGYCFFFKEGGIHVFSKKEFSPEPINILAKFAKVFGQTYTRFLDLQKAEALARVAVRESSQDRVRANIAAIRTTTDLQQITPLIWNELKTLGIPFIRCGVFIMDEERELVHTYLSTPEGKAIAAFQLPYCGISVTEKSLPHWRNQTIYKDHWDKKDFLDWSHELIDKGYIDSEESYRVDLVPDHLYLYFVPFVQGMLYVGNSESLPKESLSLIKSLADAFATAYARYEDFNKLEDAKEKIEKAFIELQDAKDQLVQQEKLASLGQLSAGIAHEIKNPLNFVNNFSELSIELINELISDHSDGLDQRGEDIRDVLDDVRTNLLKIHQHGTRADQIVKSMLQQSRGSSGLMESTNLNELINEYVNLAYHGMRAGKNPINVNIQFDLDESLGEIPLVAEDFSRVLLNLCHNAFDAMRSRSLSNIPLAGNKDRNENGIYQPMLNLRTSRDNGSILIEVEDNGIGIPEEIKDKILQPFFTTKKGNQGTGLGLSITNDIIKAHGGQLRIETKENSFSIFKIQLTEFKLVKD